MKLDRALAGAIIFLVLLTLVFHLSTLFLGDVYSPSGDILYQNYPWRLFYSQELKAGRLPYWYPGQACGFPLFAEGQIGPLYPPNLLLYRVFDTWTAINIGAALSTFFAGLGALFLFRRLRLSISASAFGASIFMISGPLTAHLGHLNLVAAVSWMPWIIFGSLAVAESAEKKRFVYFVATGFAILISIFAGHPQMTMISIISAAIFIFAYGVISRRGIGKSLVAILIAPVAPAIVAGLSAGLCIWPTVELLRHSNRAGFTLADFLSYSYPPHMALTYLYPFFFGPANSWQSPDYRGPQGFVEFVSFIGPVPLIAAFAAFVFAIRFWKAAPKLDSFFGRAAESVKLLVACDIAYFILALGKWAGVYALFYIIPGFGASRIPARFIIPDVLMAAGLAAIGFDLLIRRASNSKFSAALIAVAMFALSVWPLLWFHSKFNLTSSAEAALPVPHWFALLARNDPGLRIYYEEGEKRPDLGSQESDVEFAKPCYPWLAGIPSVGWAGELVLNDYKKFCDTALSSDGSNLEDERKSEMVAWLGAVPSYPSPITKPPKPGYYLCGAYEKLASQDEILERIADSYPVYLDQLAMGTNEISVKPSLEGFSSVRLVKGERPGEDSFEIACDTDKIFVRAVSWYPGWSALLDDTPVNIFKVNAAFQGVEIPAGKHTLKFRYNKKLSPPAIFLPYIVFAALIAAARFLSFRRV
ncbi:MAG: hypothetical protein HRF49_06555 [bacterium]